MKRALKVGQVGDVMHFSKFYNERANARRDFEYRVWAVIERIDRDTGNMKVRIISGALRGQVHTADPDCDVGRIVSGDQLSDYILSRVAFYKLIGADGDAD